MPQNGNELGKVIEDLAARLRTLEKLDLMPEITGAGVTTDGATPATLAVVTPNVDTTTYLLAYVVARRTGGAAGAANDGGAFIIEAAYKVVGGVVTLIGSGTVSGPYQDQAWSVAFVISASTVQLRATGALNNTVYWRAWVRVRSASAPP